MSKILTKIIFLISLISVFTACSDSNEPLAKEKLQCELCFGLNILDITAKADGDVQDECYGLEQLKALAESGQLRLSIVCSSPMLELPDIAIEVAGNRLITEPVTFNIDPEEAKCIVISGVNVTNLSGDILYFGIHANSPYAQWLGSGSCLPLEIIVDKDDIYSIKTVGLSVICIAEK